MEIADTVLEIRTLGQFNITMAGKAVAIDWPNDNLKLFFCSLLSPLDLYFTWDRLCRSMLGVPETRASRRQLEEEFIQPLKSFLLNEFGFNPLIAGREDIRIKKQQIKLDAREFLCTAVDGLRLLSLGNRAEAQEKLDKANLLYAGSYLPEIHGKIITSTRNDLESLYQALTMKGLRQAVPFSVSQQINNPPVARSTG